MADIVNLFPYGIGAAGSSVFGSILGQPQQLQSMSGLEMPTPLDMAILQRQAQAQALYNQQNALHRVEPIRDPWERRHREPWNDYRKRLAKGVLAGQLSANFVFGVYKAHAAEEDRADLAKHATRTP